MADAPSLSLRMKRPKVPMHCAKSLIMFVSVSPLIDAPHASIALS